MKELEEHIIRVNKKLQQLLKQYQLLQKEHEQQSRVIEELKSYREKDENQIKTLQQQVTILKAATLQMDAADKKAFEKTINQYIREIDKCINLLSE